MNNYFLLTRIFFKCGLGSQGASGRIKKGRLNLDGPQRFLLVGVCLLPMIFQVYQGVLQSFDMLQAAGAEKLILTNALSIGTITTMIFGIPMVLSVFYTASDIKTLMAFPLSPSCIVAAKWTVSLVYEYMMVVMLVLPMLAAYGTASHASAGYWILMVLICLLLPVMPLLYAAVFCMIIMRLFRRMRNKGAIQLAAFVISLIFAFGISFLSGTAYGDASVSSLRTSSRAMSGVNLAFPHLAFAGRALENLSVPDLLIAVLMMAAAFLIFLAVARTLYFKGVIGMSETTQIRKQLTGVQTRKYTAERIPLSAYARIEIKKILRSPLNLFNCILMEAIWPLFLLIPLLWEGKGENESGAGLTVLLSFISKDAGKEGSLAVLLLVTMVIIYLMGSMNLMTATTISREGKAVFFMKMIPMSFRDQLRAKVLSSAPVTLAIEAVYLLIMDLAAISHGMTPLILLMTVAWMLPAVIIANYIQLFLELVFPKLVWENEAVPVKQNLHALAASGIILAVGAGMLFTGTELYLRVKAGLPVAFAVVTALQFVLAAILRKAVLAYGEKRMQAVA